MGFSSTRSPNPLTCASRFFSLCIFLSVTCIYACVINACIREWGKVRFDVQMERARELSPAPAPPWMGRQIFLIKRLPTTKTKEQGCARSALVKTTTKRSLHVHE